MKMKFFPKEASWDVIQPWCTLCLLAIGVTTIYSAQLSFSGEQWKIQLMWAGIGLGIYLVASRLDYEFYLRHAHWIYVISIGLLLSLWTPLGVRRFGAVRWLRIGGLRIQPSELAKVAILFMTASILARSEVGEIKRSWQVLFKIGAIWLLPASLIFFQPDLGSMLALPPVVFALLLISPLSGKFFLSILGVVLVMISIVTYDIYAYRLYLDKHQLNPLKDVGQYESRSWLPLKDYQRNRVLAFVLPQVMDPQGTGISWNLRQSLIAIGSGGIRGKGFCRGSQSKLGYLPQSVAANDFIFSVMAEEYGFTGGVIVFLLYTLMIANSFRIAWMARDSFGCFIATGAGVLWMVHIGINIGMTLGLMPITGIPLPFLSYGGSFLILCCFLQGMLQSVYHYRYHYT